jgi:hypothetical protein
MAAADESVALKAQHEAARHARLAALAEEARAQADVDTGLIKQQIEQSVRLQTAQLQQQLRHLAEQEAAATAEMVAADAARIERAHRQTDEGVRVRLAKDEAWIAGEQARREGAVADEMQDLFSGVALSSDDKTSPEICAQS